MNKFKYLKISQNKQIRYLDNNYKEKNFTSYFYMVLCQILKVKNLRLYSSMQKKITLAFLLVEYSGHGKSSGKFTKGNITQMVKRS